MVDQLALIAEVGGPAEGAFAAHTEKLSVLKTLFVNSHPARVQSSTLPAPDEKLTQGLLDLHQIQSQRKVIKVLTRHEEIMLVCGNCGSDVAVGVRFCQNCGAVVQVTAPKVDLLPFKIERTAILLAALPGVLIMGVGHFYLARIARGLIILGASIVTGMVFFVAVFGGFFSSSLLVAALVGSVRLALWIWQIVDVRKLTKKYNESLEGTGKPPW